MARAIPPWLAEPVVPTSGTGGARGRFCGLGARPWFPAASATEGRWQTVGAEHVAMLGMAPGPVQLPEAWVRSLSVPPSVQMTDECGFSTPMHSPRPASVPTMPLTPHSAPMGPCVRCSSSLSPRASSTSYLGPGRRSMPEGPAIPSQRKAANGFPLNALSCPLDVDVRNAGTLQTSAKVHFPSSAVRVSDPGEALPKSCKTSHILVERNQVPQVVDCKEGRIHTQTRSESSEYIVYASQTSMSNNATPVNGVSDGSPKNSVWKRYFAENPDGHSSHGYGQRRLPHRIDEKDGSLGSDSRSSPSLPATAPNSERGNLEAVNLQNLGGRSQMVEKTETKPNVSVHENARKRFLESQDLQRGLRDAVGLFGFPAVEATANCMDVEGNSKEMPAASVEHVESRHLERRPSDRSVTSQKNASNPNDLQFQVDVDGQPQVPSQQMGSGRPESFVPDAAQVEAITQSAAKVDAAARNISLKHLYELRSFRQPPAAICQVAEAALSLFGINANWSSGRRRLDSQFLNKLKSFTPLEAARCPSAQVHQFLEHLDAPAFSDESSLGKCPGAAPLAQWCFAAAALLIHLRQAEHGLPDGKLKRFQVNGKMEPGAPKVEIRTLRAPVRHEVHKKTGIDFDLGGLFVKPKLWELNSDELQCVEDLVIGREGVGHVTFHGKTDCRGLLDQLSQILSIQPGEIIVYPDATLKPDVGQGLNKPASVQLHGCMPKCQTRLTDTRAQQRYKQRVAEMTREKGAIFEDYDPVDGTWKFRVPHF